METTFRPEQGATLPPQLGVALAVRNRYHGLMKQFDRITFKADVMGGKACIRGLRVTAGMVIGLLAAGRTRDEILQAYPYLQPEDIDQALAYAAWRLEEQDAPSVSV